MNSIGVEALMEEQRGKGPWPPTRGQAAVGLVVPLGLKLLSPTEEVDYLLQLSQIAAGDVEGLVVARRDYGDSWRKRGGVGAYMMAVRKSDRLEQLLSNPKGFNRYDIIEAVLAEAKSGGEGDAVLDCVRDLRRYLLLIEAYAATQAQLPLQRDNAKADRLAKRDNPAPVAESPEVVIADASPAA